MVFNNSQNVVSKMQSELIDTHAHLAFEPLVNDLEAVLDRSRQAGVTRWITVGTNTPENAKSIDLTLKHEGVYAAVGIHPHFAEDADDSELVTLEKMIKSNKVVAVGETGLDFHYNFSKQSAQKDVFKKQLAIAEKLQKPVIVHSRQAFDDTMKILDDFSLGKVVFHCFTGTGEQAKAALEKGFHISFTGVLTFKNAYEVRQAAEIVPLDRIMLETDCPYMSPEPMRKQKVNEPALMIHTAKFLAELKGVKYDELTSATTQTAKNFFNLKT